MKFLTYIFLSFFIITIFSCDKIDDPFPPTDDIDTGIVWDDSVQSISNGGVRYVLMEEFTGHKCNNCPKGVDEIERLKKIHGDKFISIAIHVTDAFASAGPAGGAPNGSYPHDHRTPDGDAYQKFFSIASLPGGSVSRRNKPLVTVLKWGPEAVIVYDNPGPTIANLHITSYFDVNPNAGDTAETYRVRVIIEWLEDYTEGLSLQVQLSENDIEDWQQDAREDPQHIENYLHKHMYRGAVNGTWGEPVEAASKGDRDTLDYVRNFNPDLVSLSTSIVKENVSVIAFLYKNDADDKEVMQVNEVHLINHP